MQKINKAFTLIELLVVIAIIGILSALIIVGMNLTTQKANIAKGQVFSNSLRNSLMDNLISEWRFDELTTAVEGQSIQDKWNSFNGTLYTGSDGFEKISSDCPSGKCLIFDGTDDYVNVGTKPQLNSIADAITVSAWVKTITTIDNHDIIGRGNDWSFLRYGGTYEFEIRNSSNVIVKASGAISTPDWVFVSGSYDKNIGFVNLYINGVLKNSMPQTGPIRTGQIQNQIGNGYEWHPGGTYNDFWWNGSLDEVRVFSAAIPASQIQQDYFAGLNKLFAKKLIKNTEYSDRLADLSIDSAKN